MKVDIQEIKLQEAAAQGTDAFLTLIHDTILAAVGGEVNAQTLPLLSGEQTTLLAYYILRDEVMDGGFIQLIHNGLGQFIFFNPFEKAIAAWGMDDFARLIKKGRKAYLKHRAEIERECTDEEFMAMFEMMPEFDELDDDFVANEEQWTSQIAYYIDENIEKFAVITKD